MTTTEATGGREEKRRDDRLACDAPIKWSYFNQSRCFDARILNCSLNGCYFETHEAIEPHTTIFIRLDTQSPESIKIAEQECLRTATVGEVKWCHEISKDSTGRYGVGVRCCHIR